MRSRQIRNRSRAAGKGPRAQSCRDLMGRHAGLSPKPITGRRATRRCKCRRPRFEVPMGRRRTFSCWWLNRSLQSDVTKTRRNRSANFSTNAVIVPKQPRRVAGSIVWPPMAKSAASEPVVGGNFEDVRLVITSAIVLPCVTAPASLDQRSFRYPDSGCPCSP